MTRANSQEFSFNMRDGSDKQQWYQNEQEMQRLVTIIINRSEERLASPSKTVHMTFVSAKGLILAIRINWRNTYWRSVQLVSAWACTWTNISLLSNRLAFDSAGARENAQGSQIEKGCSWLQRKAMIWQDQITHTPNMNFISWTLHMERILPLYGCEKSRNRRQKKIGRPDSSA
jgi:hypothetical protein